MRTVLSIMMLVLFISLSPTFNVEAGMFGSLKGDIQDEIKANPFLKKQGISLKIAEEENGYVSLEMVEGNRTVRNAIKEGMGLDSPLWALANPEEKSTVDALRKTLEVIKSLDGVKSITLSALVGTPKDMAEDLQIRFANEPEWVRALFSNEIIPGKGMAGLNLGDSIEKVISLFGPPSFDLTKELKLKDGTKKTMRIVGYNKKINNSNNYLTMTSLDSKIINSIYIKGFFRDNIPKVKNTNISTGSQRSDVGKKINNYKESYNLLSTKKYRNTYKAYNYDGYGIRLATNANSNDSYIDLIIVPNYFYSSNFTFERN